MGKRRTINPDHIRDRNVPAPETEVIATRLQELLSPLVYNQLGYYQQLGLRSRILGLPLMMAAHLTLLWRQVPSVLLRYKKLVMVAFCSPILVRGKTRI